MIREVCYSISLMELFIQLKSTATWLRKKMTDDGHAVTMLTSDIPIEERISILNRYLGDHA